MDLEAFAQLSSDQFGTFTRQQVMSLGASPAMIRQRVESGLWTRTLPSVYALAGHRDSWHRRLWAAHLHAGPGSVICLDSAAELQGAGGVQPGRVQLMVPGNRGHQPTGVRWYRRIDLLEEEVVRLPGLPPMTSPARTAVDLAATMHVARLRLFVEAGHVERRFRLAEVGTILDRVRRSGKHGVRNLAKVLDDLGPGDGIPRSHLERLGDDVIELAGLPAPQHEHPLPNLRGRTGFVDRCWPEAKLIVELDGRRWHDRFQQRLQDADRRLEAQVCGYETSEVLWEHATSDRQRTAEILATVYRRRVELHAND